MWKNVKVNIYALNDLNRRYRTMNDKEKLIYFMCCLARDRGIKTEYFDFDKRSEIINFTKENKVVNEDAYD
jgi:hypothetical protein